MNPFNKLILPVRSFEPVWKQMFRCDISTCIINWQDYVQNNKTLTGLRNQIFFQSNRLSRLWTRQFLVYRLHRGNSARTYVGVCISIKRTKTVWIEIPVGYNSVTFYKFPVTQTKHFAELLQLKYFSNIGVNNYVLTS